MAELLRSFKPESLFRVDPSKLSSISRLVKYGCYQQELTFVCLLKQKDRSEYVYDQQSNVWLQKDDIVDKKLEKGVHVRYRITTLKYMNSEFSVVGTIDEDFLGAFKQRIYDNMMRE